MSYRTSPLGLSGSQPSRKWKLPMICGVSTQNIVNPATEWIPLGLTDSALNTGFQIEHFVSSMGHGHWRQKKSPRALGRASYVLCVQDSLLTFSAFVKHLCCHILLSIIQFPSSWITSFAEITPNICPPSTTEISVRRRRSGREGITVQ
jgi:hypothetical protein